MESVLQCRLWSERSFLCGLLADADFADVVFHCKDKRAIMAHQVVVLEQSSLLKSFATSTFGAKNTNLPALHVSLPDARVETMSSLLALLYTGRVEEKSMVKVDQIKTLASCLGMNLNLKTIIKKGSKNEAKIVQRPYSDGRVEQKERSEDVNKSDESTNDKKNKKEKPKMVSTECQTDLPSIQTQTDATDLKDRNAKGSRRSASPKKISEPQQQQAMTSFPAMPQMPQFVPSAAAEAYYAQYFNRPLFPFGAFFDNGGSKGRKRRQRQMDESEDEDYDDEDEILSVRSKNGRKKMFSSIGNKRPQQSNNRAKMRQATFADMPNKGAPAPNENEGNAEGGVEVRFIEGHKVFACTHCERIFTLANAAEDCVKACSNTNNASRTVHKTINVDYDNVPSVAPMNQDPLGDNGGGIQGVNKARPRRSAMKTNYSEDNFPDLF